MAGAARPTTAALAATSLVAMAALASCSSGSGKHSSPTSATIPTTSTVASSTSSSSPPTTRAASTTAATSRPTTTPPASSPEGYAKTLYEAWARGDRPAAERVAQPQAVADLFARPWQASDGWAFAECSGAAGSVICTWQRPAGQLLVRVRNLTGGLPVTVTDVRFQP